jgi:hypothetical protein
MPDRLAARAAGASAGEMKGVIAISLGALLLSACSSTPTYGPGILVLPGTGRTFDQFRFDEQDCRSYAQTQITKANPEQDSAGSFQQRYDRAFLQCMYAKGHKVPVSGRYSDHADSAPAAARTPPPPPPGLPPPEAPPDYRPK